jgi:16S rRNA (cytosine967-C5)-methyltransferase
VLDACAAPGGKATLMAGVAGPTAQIIAGDNRPGRVATLLDLIRQSGARVPVVALDAAAGLPFGAVFDRVLLDAPCSGTGVLRRDPDIKWQPVALADFADTQARMIREAARVVNPGGTLLYATCSSEPEENDEVVAAFLRESSEYALAPVTFEWESALAARLVDAAGFLRTRPFLHELDAYFAARLVRRRNA